MNDVTGTTTTRRVDAHVHLWKVARGDYPWMSADVPVLYRDYEPADVKVHLDQAGFSDAIVVQAAPTPAETDFLLALAAQTPFVSGVIGWTDLASDQVGSAISRLRSNGDLKGVRPMLQDIADPDWILGAAVSRGLRALADNDLILEFLITPRHLEQTLEVLTRHPGLRAIIDHGAKPAIRKAEFDAWAAQMARLARETTAYCKISGLVTEAGAGWSSSMLRPYVEHLLAEFGSERLVFGSDWPVINTTCSYEAWLECLDELFAGLDATERSRIFGLNATEFYRLGEYGTVRPAVGNRGRGQRRS